MTQATTTRERLARAAIRLFVRQGLAATTTKQIAAAARLAEGTIYRYFPAKEEMAATLFRENYVALVGELRDAARAARTPLEQLPAMISRFYRLFDDDRDLFAFLFLASPEQPRLPGSVMTPLRLLRETLADIKSPHTAADRLELTTQLVFGLVVRPPEAALLGQLPGPLAPRADAVAQAVHRLLRS
jgi:AcrR family transcriptional regulator